VTGKTLYAQTLIELPDEGRLAPGEKVPADLDGLDELIDGGAVADSPPANDDKEGENA
jgi:hypothetical protein